MVRIYRNIIRAVGDFSPDDEWWGKHKQPVVGLDSSNLRISFESFERCKLLEIKFMISFNIRLLLTSLNDSYESVLVWKAPLETETVNPITPLHNCSTASLCMIKRSECRFKVWKKPIEKLKGTSTHKVLTGSDKAAPISVDVKVNKTQTLKRTYNHVYIFISLKS